MRNSLAEEVLDKRMLFLMEVFDILLLKTILQVIMPVMLRWSKEICNSICCGLLVSLLEIIFPFLGVYGDV